MKKVLGLVILLLGFGVSSASWDDSVTATFTNVNHFTSCGGKTYTISWVLTGAGVNYITDQQIYVNGSFIAIGINDRSFVWIAPDSTYTTSFSIRIKCSDNNYVYKGLSTLWSSVKKRPRFTSSDTTMVWLGNRLNYVLTWYDSLNYATITNLYKPTQIATDTNTIPPFPAHTQTWITFPKLGEKTTTAGVFDSLIFRLSAPSLEVEETLKVRIYAVIPTITLLKPSQDTSVVGGTTIPVQWQTQYENTASPGAVTAQTKIYGSTNRSIWVVLDSTTASSKTVMVPNMGTSTFWIKVVHNDQYGAISVDTSNVSFHITQTPGIDLTKKIQQVTKGQEIISVYDSMGRLVYSGDMAALKHKTFNGGVYFMALKNKGFHKAMMVR